MEQPVLLLVNFAAFWSSFMFLILVSTAEPNGAGKWKLLSGDIGVSAMHMALLPNDKIIVFDRTNFGPSNITLPLHKCAGGGAGTGGGAEQSCFAHSVEFDPFKRTIRPLTILTDTWCSSGALSSEGELIQTGGFRDGERVVRFFKPCLDCDWRENPNGLVSPRWYASNQVLPDGRIIIVGGSFQYSYEFIPKSSESDTKLFQLPFLKETLHSATIPNNLYPFLHLCPDGNLFVFANNRAILLDYVKNIVLRNYPTLPGGISRNYPSTGSSVLLPLDLTSQKPVAEVLICGGTEPDSNQKADGGIFESASKSCGRIVINSESPAWEIEEMPVERVMGDMIMLPTGDVLIINGAAKGSAGWGMAREPIFNPVLYLFNQKPDKTGGFSRFKVLNPSVIPRLYHSTAHLLSDGRVLVGGSNPNANYNFTVMYPTELSVEAFYPPYLTASSGSSSRPVITALSPDVKLSYGERFRVEFGVKSRDDAVNVTVTVVAPSFTTHSFAMNQRLLVLACGGASRKGGSFIVECGAPATGAVAPPGYYQLFVVRGGVPSRAKWIHIQ